MNKPSYLSYPAIVTIPGQYSKLRNQWDNHYYEAHRNSVKKVKAVVDNKAPRTYLHFHIKMKKMQMEQERLAAIERDNRLLIEKMAHIMSTTGRVENWNDYESKSLNIGLRHRELVKITLENHAILRRINNQKPIYNHSKWIDNFQTTRGYIANITKYPDVSKKSDKVTCGHSMPMGCLTS
ncbi:sperm axonemal maintenance protein CFAP97D1-like [Acipenser ruthenus]|uniref:sperm axonemal maintenance protein CFAP97D1-like n=1 Tax=Acipenser ruthenus TaxID=7906 RepID=UPI00274297D8|nr:sperm axonemal maintenance protein CFAP97D1-like [Acipenser ruthenus]